ncbi:MAG: hypothetical protein E7523_10265 [Ruminococcaceae bacterium]|nr:hypothetical protein [Oscillospiraceae bacterium]
MNIPKIITAVGQIDDELIAAAVDYKPKKKQKKIIILRFAVPAACLLLVLSAFVLHPEINDEFFGSKLPWNQDDAVYKTAVFDVTEPIEPVQLFAYAAELPAQIRETVTTRYGVDTNQYFCVFDCTDENAINYWFPVITDGKIFNFVYATLADDGQVTTASSISDADELNAIASLTDEENPVLVVTDGFIIYYIIADTAYVSQRQAQYCPESIGEIKIPFDELRVAEIS